MSGYNNGDFNTYVDESNEQVRIFDLGYRASEVLFAVDHEAYRDLLANFKPGDDDAVDGDATEAIGSTP